MNKRLCLLQAHRKLKINTLLMSTIRISEVIAAQQQILDNLPFFIIRFFKSLELLVHKVHLTFTCRTGFICIKQLVVCTLRQGDSAVYTYIFIAHSYLLPYGLC